MSLILEALRKSEAERRRAQAPDLFAEPQLALPRAHPAWPHWRWLTWGVVALIIGVLLVRAVWLPATPAAAARIAAAPQPAAAAPAVVASPPIQSSTPARTPAVTAMAVPPQPAPGFAPESVPPARPAVAVVVAPPPARPQPQSPPKPIAAAPVAMPAPVPAHAPATAPASAVTAGTGTQQLADLGTEERQKLPPLKLSMHMWNDAPAQRFVIIDGQRLGEGDRIGEAVVEQITRDGVILAWNGRRLRVGMR